MSNTETGFIQLFSMFNGRELSLECTSQGENEMVQLPRLLGGPPKLKLNWISGSKKVPFLHPLVHGATKSPAF